LVSNRGRAIILDWGLAKDLAAVEADEPALRSLRT
jgi:hypothetical protein